MADPYANFFKGYFNYYPFSTSNPLPPPPQPPPPPAAAPSYPTYNFYTHFNCNYNFHHSNLLNNHNNHHRSPPPSPPIREALPLLRLSPKGSKHDDVENDQSQSTLGDVAGRGHCSDAKNGISDEGIADGTAVTVALHIGLPSPTAADLISRISATTVDEHHHAHNQNNSPEDGVAEEEEGGSSAGVAIHMPLGCPTIGKLTKGQYWIPTLLRSSSAPLSSPAPSAAKPSIGTTTCRCTCGGTDRSTEKAQSHCGGRSPRRCCGCRATAARRGAEITSITRGRSRSKTSALCRRTTSANTASSHLCAASAERPSLSGVIGGRTRRTAANSGTALADPISSTSGRLRTTSRHSARGTPRMASTALTRTTTRHQRSSTSSEVDDRVYMLWMKMLSLPFC
ncbi:hypothetical protein HPP92_020511 [Vanilla planifolia]|uniref:Uncharacterized protein n=1 Tax=Vanilla planifolia TaxID=51239 RepID=A0A835QAV8_VANPL|nr:hypothetical protein HPP92_020511 [Vanilla planifolia]